MKNVIEAVGRRERKKLETRFALRRAALRLVAENGLDRVTVADIADAADVSVRTFFNHFPCKEDALVGADLHRLQKLRAALTEQPPDRAPIAALRAVIIELAAKLSDYREDLLAEMRVVQANPALRAREMSEFAQYERELVAEVARRSGTDPARDLYPLLTARVAVSAFRAALTLWCTIDDPPALSNLGGEAFDLLEQGLPPPQSR